MNFPIRHLEFDLLIIGAGGAGLTSAISAFDSGTKNIAVISKVLPTSSHTVSAKGGINASFGNVIADDWQWHAFDTIKGSDYLADFDAVELMCKKACEAILFLEQNGVVFSRDQFGQIAQRAYGGQTTEFGEGKLAFRACYSKDKTGHSIVHTLYQQALKREIKFFNEFFVVDLLVESLENQDEAQLSENNQPKKDWQKKQQKQCLGCIAIDCNQGELVVFHSKAVILATGGYSQIYRNTTSSLICTGDGTSLALQAGFALQDMEFVQFHPTGIFGQGFLITEAVRSEGAYLLNKNHDRFMINYAPKMMELASRDVISLAMANEMKEGRAVNDGFLYLDMRHLSDEVLKNKLPGVVELVKNFAKLDVKRDLIPIAPSAHYSMGGLSCNTDCEVENSGLYCIGENACISVHGANRLGCNSLLDLIVFGQIAGQNAGKKIKQKVTQNFLIFDKIVKQKLDNFAEIFQKSHSKERLNLEAIKVELQENNDQNLGVIREQISIAKASEKIDSLLLSLSDYRCNSTNLLWNEELITYFELRNLLLNSLAVAVSAQNRKESRGAHFRSDFSTRNDQDFLAHSQVFLQDSGSINFLQKTSPKLKFQLAPTRKFSSIAALQAPPQLRKY